jgi:two-component system nitrate/nitrite response regulator NarL
MDTPAIKVLIVDDHNLFAEGTAALLSSEPDIAVAGVASTAEDCLSLVKRIHPNAVLLDINLPDSCGVNLIGKIKKEVPECGIIMLTGQSPEGYIDASLVQGALGFLLKDCSKEEMVTAIRKAAKGERYFSHSLSPYLKSVTIYEKKYQDISDFNPDIGPSQTGQRDGHFSVLTPRESEVLQLIAKGFRNREIAERLGIANRTVEYHIANIMTKLNAKSRLEAVLRYNHNE